MAAIEQYIERIADQDLKEQLRLEVERLTKKKRFGLVWENHLPDNVILPEVSIRRGTKVAIKDKTPNDVFEVQSLSDNKACCINLSTMEQKTFKLCDLIAVAQRNDVIYPYLKQMDSVQNAPDSDLWHTLIEADNYHALQLLTYLYAGQVDCIYIDPPYNKPDSHDWKYNCDYVDGSDSYRHSKWLSMVEARLKIAKKLLNPKDSVLIVTIDEMEYHHLGCLLEQMFPEARIQMISSVINSGGVARDKQFFRTDEYIYIVELGDAAPSLLQLDKEWAIKADERAYKVSWRMSLVRGGSNSTRERSPGCFYPIFVSSDGSHIVDIGEPLPKGHKRDEIIAPEGTIAVWPLKTDNSEGCWQLSPTSLKEAVNNGYVRLGRFTSRGVAISYLNRKEIEKVHSEGVEIIGRRPDNSIITNDSGFIFKFIPGTQWRLGKHNARVGGTNLLKAFGLDERFSYPKSLYAVHDVLRFFLANKPNALVLDFFAGSGTTLHAVNLLNAEDNGQRRCIMVTNNEIGEPKERELLPLGFHPGDDEWEQWGIARYVNWPRTKCSILGNDINDKPVKGDYITTLTTIREVERKYTHINFLPADASFKQKKCLITLINKQKDVKAPVLKQDVPYIVSDEDGYNASVIFDVSKVDEWLDALECNDQVTNFYIVAEKDAIYKKVKEKVCHLMGNVEEITPVKMAIKDGFKANAVFFKLGFLDKRNVERGRQLQELLPLLWMKSGAKGRCPSDVEGDFIFWEDNHMALLKDEMHFRKFKNALLKYPTIETIFIITDSSNAYLSMIEELKGYKTIQLYRDYLENFRINYAVK